MFIYLAAVLFFIAPVSAQQTEQEQSVEEVYLQSGRQDAENMRRRFDAIEKPKYQQAYDQYLEDLKLIAKYGKAQDNEDLYNDIRAMNSDDEFIVSRDRPDNRPRRVPMYR